LTEAGGAAHRCASRVPEPPLSVSRREFLSLSALATAGSVGRVRADLEPDLPQCGALPPSIAALASMRDQAHPITAAERAERIARAQGLMRRQGLAAIVLTGGTSLEYFTAVRWGLSERLFALAIPADGDAFVVCPAFEEDRAREQLDLGPLGRAPVRAWDEDESPHRLLADGLRERGAATGTVGIEETVRFVFSDGLHAAAPALTLASATPVTAGCRTVKDEHEVALMRLASAVTLKAYEAAYRALTAGMTQADVGRLVSQAHERLGFTGGASVQTGPYSALPHGSATPQEIREGTILLIDGGCTVEGYESDISRTFVLGTPTDKMRRVFDLVHRAQAAALAAARPGAECQAVDAAARRVITEAGYGPGFTYFTHRVGHGIGMDGHEWPYLVGGNTLPLLPGMAFSDEPGIYIPGEFGVRLEDDMVITPTGAELLTPQSPSLEEPFGAA
jgi:Xaa-Pro dipeptidase